VALLLQLAQSGRKTAQLVLPDLVLPGWLDEFGVGWGTHAGEPALPAVDAPVLPNLGGVLLTAAFLPLWLNRHLLHDGGETQLFDWEGGRRDLRQTVGSLFFTLCCLCSDDGLLRVYFFIVVISADMGIKVYFSELDLIDIALLFEEL
jgi:hypothetical protein